MRRSDAAARDPATGFLNERVAPVVEGHRVDDAGAAGLIDECPGIRSGHGERLVGDDVLASGERRGNHRVVQVIRRGVVHDLHVGIVEQRLVIPVAFRNAECLRLLMGRRVARARQRHHVDEAESSHGIDMVRPDEPGAHEAHPDSFGWNHRVT